jgi:multimeric flavodoxin WrbA
MDRLKAVAFTCSLKSSPAESSTDVLTKQLLDELQAHDVDTKIFRVVDYDIKPGVKSNMGPGDAWPSLRVEMLDADIFILATPTWVGHMSSEAQRVIERLDAELSFSDDAGRLRTYGKVAAAVIVGNEDGAHKISADIFQALNDIGFTIPAGGVTYWNGEAMGNVDYKDLPEAPENVITTTRRLAINAVHIARLLRANEYPKE